MEILLSDIARVCETLFDRAKFETSQDGIVYGDVNGRRSCLLDFGIIHQENPFRLTEIRVRAFREAAEKRIPIIYWNSNSTNTSYTTIDAAARNLLLDPVNGIGALYASIASCCGRTTQISVLTGDPRHSRVLPFALSDVCIFVKGATAQLGKSDLVKVLLNEEQNLQLKGGMDFHSEITGLADLSAPDVFSAFKSARRYLEITDRVSRPSSAEIDDCSAEMLAAILARDPSHAFDMHKALNLIVDLDSLLEVRPLLAPEVITAYASIDGIKFSLIANNSLQSGGFICPATARKMARHISLASVYELPVIFLADTSGFMIGQQAELDGIICAAAHLFHALEISSAPKLSIVLRRGFSSGLYAMGGPGFGDEFAILGNAQVGVVSDNLAGRIQRVIPRPTSEFYQSSTLPPCQRVTTLQSNEVRSFIKRFISSVHKNTIRTLQTAIFPR